MLITASVSALIALRYSRNTAGIGGRAAVPRVPGVQVDDGRPGPAAATDWLTTSSTVYGRCGDMVGV